MERLQTLIKNGEVYYNGDFVKANIGVKDGKIAFIANAGEELPPADTVIDAEGKHVLPGLVDTHVHVREPGFTHKEDFITASQAAAAGGVTTIVDMPNVKPSTNTVERIREQKKLAAQKSLVDFITNLSVENENNPINSIDIKNIEKKAKENKYNITLQLAFKNPNHDSRK